MNKYDVAILGATGAVGEALINILEERDFPVRNLYPLASANSAGKTVLFKNKNIEVIDVAEFDFSKAQIGLFSAGGSVSAQYAPIAADNGCIVIDNTSHFRYDHDIPLIIPEVNPERIADYRNRNIIANPNCSTIQMLVTLKPIYDAVGLTRVNVCTYQSVSGAGSKGITELANQTASLLNAKGADVEVFSKQIAFNVIPQIDSFEDNGYTREEMKMVWETHKILGDDRVLVNPTAVRVPVFYGHSEAIHLETRQKLSKADAVALLKKSPGIVVQDRNNKFPTAVEEGSNEDAVYVGRIREDISCENGLNLWVVANNVRKGAALNAVQIAELLIDSTSGFTH